METTIIQLKKEVKETLTTNQYPSILDGKNDRYATWRILWPHHRTRGFNGRSRERCYIERTYSLDFFFGLSSATQTRIFGKSLLVQNVKL